MMDDKKLIEELRKRCKAIGLESSDNDALNYLASRLAGLPIGFLPGSAAWLFQHKDHNDKASERKEEKK